MPLSCHKSSSGRSTWGAGCGGSGGLITQSAGQEDPSELRSPTGCGCLHKEELNSRAFRSRVHTKREKNKLTNEQINRPRNKEMNELVGGVKAREGRGTALVHSGWFLFWARMRREINLKVLVPSLFFLLLYQGIIDKENCMYLRYITWSSDIRTHGEMIATIKLMDTFVTLHSYPFKFFWCGKNTHVSSLANFKYTSQYY